MSSGSAPARDSTEILKAKVDDFRNRTKLPWQLLLGTALVVFAIFAGFMIKALLTKETLSTIVNSASIFALLSFARSIYDRMIDFERECIRLEALALKGDIEAFQKALATLSLRVQHQSKQSRKLRESNGD